MDTVDGISDEILKKADEYIKELLKNKRLKAETRAQLEIQSYFMMFLVSDHEKVNQIYPHYKKQIARQKKVEEWWNKLQWVAIPIIVTSLFGFIANALEIIWNLWQKISP